MRGGRIRRRIESDKKGNGQKNEGRRSAGVAAMAGTGEKWKERTMSSDDSGDRGDKLSVVLFAPSSQEQDIQQRG